MTAMTLLVQPKRRAAYLMSDTAYTGPDGRVVRFGGKVIGFDRFPAAIGLQGNLPLAMLGAAIQAHDPRNLRTLLKLLPGALRAALDAAGQANPGQVVTGTLRVAAYSSREKRPCGFICTSDPVMAGSMIGDAQRTFEVIEAHDAPSYDVPLAELLGRPCELGDLTTFDPHQHTGELIAAQRRRAQTVVAPGYDEAARHRIGGEAELTEVTRHGFKCWGCATFPDRVGERISV